VGATPGGLQALASAGEPLLSCSHGTAHEEEKKKKQKRSHLVTEIDGARLGVVERGGVAEDRQERPRGVEPRAARDREGRSTARVRPRPRPVRDGALPCAACERGEVVAGIERRSMSTADRES